MSRYRNRANGFANLRSRLFALTAIAVLGVGILFGSLYVGFVALALLLVVLFAYYPRAAVIFWLFVICFVPFWFGIALGAGPYISPATAAGLVVILSAFVKNRTAFGKADVWAIAVLLACIVPGIAGFTRVGDLSTAVSQWALGFVVGRLLAQRAGYRFTLNAVVVLLSIVGILAIVEFVGHWNPFVGLSSDNVYYAEFSRLQERGGILRAEGAFGHSIALGHSLVLAIPLAMASDWRLTPKTLSLIALIGGAICSFSRSAQISAVIAIVLSVLFLSHKISVRQRAFVIIAVIGSAILVLPFVEQILSGAGAEARDSTDYRSALLTLLQSARPLGVASNYSEVVPNDVSFGSFTSIDSTYIAFAVRYGLVALAAAVAGTLAMIIATLRKRASVPMVSLVAILPGIITASLITQYGMFVWFFVGLAALGQQEERRLDLERTRTTAASSSSSVAVMPNRPSNKGVS